MNKLPFLLLLMVSCRQDPPRKVQETLPEQKIKDQFVTANNRLAMKEKDEMDQYAKNHRLPFVETPSGIRYYVYRHSEAGDSIRDGMQVSMDYTLSLLDGTVSYTSDKSGRRSFVVGHDEVESGLHRGIQHLKRGDKALIMIPSALAHGLLGDREKIPPQMPIVYNVKVY
jgi:FKBP-type peptidyl-prolyl cis-trans isomerase